MPGYQEADPDSPFVRPHSYSISFRAFLRNPGSNGSLGLKEQCDEFINMLRCLKQLSLVQMSLDRRIQAQYRNVVFCSGRPLHSLLSPKPKNQKQKVARLAALLHINAALWDYRWPVSLSERFLQGLDSKVRQLDLCPGTDTPTLAWLMLHNETDRELRRPERPWFVGQMLRIAKRLCPSSWEKVTNTLLHYLVDEPDTDTVPTFKTWIMELREEIMTAPISS
jgi:hypothetical protein